MVSCAWAGGSSHSKLQRLGPGADANATRGSCHCPQTRGGMGAAGRQNSPPWVRQLDASESGSEPGASCCCPPPLRGQDWSLPGSMGQPVGSGGPCRPL